MSKFAGVVVLVCGLLLSSAVYATDSPTVNIPITITFNRPCNLLAGKPCAEAHSLTHALVNTYTGPLFQIALASNHASTLDIGQTASHVADMTTWSAFCGGVQTNCVYSKIYSQIHATSNDAVPGTYQNPIGCATNCYAPFSIDPTTGLPWMTVGNGQPTPEYTLAADAALTGVNGGTNDITVLLVARTIPYSVSPCCGSFGLGHFYTDPNTTGTNFEIAVNYNGSVYFMGTDYEGTGQAGCSKSAAGGPIDVIDMIAVNSGSTLATGISNGTVCWSGNPPFGTAINAGTHLRVGGGGDVSQPAPLTFRDGMIFNAFLTPADEAVIETNLRSFYSQLTFP